MLCPQCRNNIEPGRTSCSNCGYKIDSGQSGRGKGSWFKSAPGVFTLLALGCLLGIIFATYGLFSPGVLEDVIEKQLSAIKDKHFTQAYYDYTDKDFQSETSLEEFRRFITSLPPFLDNQTIQFTDRIVEGDFALVKATLFSNEGQKLDVLYKLSKSDNKWKILSLQIATDQEALPTGDKRMEPGH